MWRLFLGLIALSCIYSGFWQLALDTRIQAWELDWSCGSYRKEVLYGFSSWSFGRPRPNKDGQQCFFSTRTHLKKNKKTIGFFGASIISFLGAAPSRVLNRGEVHCLLQLPSLADALQKQMLVVEIADIGQRSFERRFEREHEGCFQHNELFDRLQLRSFCPHKIVDWRLQKEAAWSSQCHDMCKCGPHIAISLVALVLWKNINYTIDMMWKRSNCNLDIFKGPFRLIGNKIRCKAQSIVCFHLLQREPSTSSNSLLPRKTCWALPLFSSKTATSANAAFASLCWFSFVFRGWRTKPGLGWALLTWMHPPLDEAPGWALDRWEGGLFECKMSSFQKNHSDIQWLSNGMVF